MTVTKQTKERVLSNAAGALRSRFESPLGPRISAFLRVLFSCAIKSISLGPGSPTNIEMVCFLNYL
jgi:hypothetical protein